MRCVEALKRDLTGQMIRGSLFCHQFPIAEFEPGCSPPTLNNRLSAHTTLLASKSGT